MSRVPDANGDYKVLSGRQIAWLIMQEKATNQADHIMKDHREFDALRIKGDNLFGFRA